MTFARVRKTKTAATIGVVALVTGVTSIDPAEAQSAEEFYKGKTIELVIGYSPGGGYDTYARLIARHLGNHIPGKPSIVPKNMPGAGSRAAAQYVYNVAPKDGTVLATVDQSMAVQQAMGDPSIKFDTNKFIYIGNPASENNTIVTWHTSGIKTIEDAKKQEVPMGSTGSNTSSQYVLALNALAGTKFKVIAGYPGGNDINLAMEKGEVAGRGSNSWGSWKATRPQWLAEKKINILAQVGLKKTADLPDVPLLMDLVSSEEDRAAMRLLSSPTTIGRPIFTTPGVPEERVKALRAAFDQMIKDPAFLEEANKLKLDIDPVSGEELQRIVADIVATPKPIAERLLKAIGGFEKP
ncbi:MAG TPA: tripartite tricarboxylate transporter substrate-binding protein [Hyphomicrobiaceae bacterium]|nr:tripartite tricarboxylate transporter substrate-binding protein [Hyphomicrobiaceae bacterium]